MCGRVVVAAAEALAGGAGGGGVNDAAALCWRRWRRRREQGDGVGGNGDHYGGDGGDGEGGGGEVGWLKGSKLNTRHEGGRTVSVVPFGVRNGVLALPGHISGGPSESSEEDVNRESPGYPCEIRPVCRISDSRRFTI